MTKFNLIVDTDEGAMLIGHLHSDTLDAADIRKLWDEFQDTQPDADDQFILFLKLRKYKVDRDTGVDVGLSRF